MTNSHEPIQNDPVQALIDANEIAGLAIARNTEGFDSTGADMIMRNIAVICDRMQPQDFNALSQEARDQVAVVAHISHDLAPMKEIDREKHGNETDEQHQYRIGVWGPIHTLQSKVHISDFNEDDKLQMSKIRFGVVAASKAFGAVLQETQNLPQISETVRYFQSNTDAAVRSASR